MRVESSEQMRRGRREWSKSQVSSQVSTSEGRRQTVPILEGKAAVTVDTLPENTMRASTHHGKRELLAYCLFADQVCLVDDWMVHMCYLLSDRSASCSDWSL